MNPSAAETLVHEEFLLEDEAILAAYRNACDELAAEVGIPFDRDTSSSHIDPDEDTEDLCELLDEVRSRGRSSKANSKITISKIEI